jgi:hypothetical protein
MPVGGPRSSAVCDPVQGCLVGRCGPVEDVDVEAVLLGCRSTNLRLQILRHDGDGAEGQGADYPLCSESTHFTVFETAPGAPSSG